MRQKTVHQLRKAGWGRPGRLGVTDSLLWEVSSIYDEIMEQFADDFDGTKSFGHLALRVLPL